MCEILVVTQAVCGRGATVAPQVLPNQGDALAVQPDGFNWGNDEMNNPLFRIIKLPGVPVATYAYLTDPPNPEIAPA